MQDLKPDADGFVTVTWPSKTIPYGGVFHTKVAKQSPETQNFLKVLLDESKLSIVQRDKERYENSFRRAPPPPPPDCAPPPCVRPQTSKRRSLSAIRASGIYQNDEYRPLRRGEDRDKLKQRLQHVMAYGDDDPPPAARARPEPVKVLTEKDLQQELLTQIRERAEWLADMEQLGAAGPHRGVVSEQIAARVRALRALGLDPPSARSSASGFSVRATPASGRGDFHATPKGDVKPPSARSSVPSVRASARASERASERASGRASERASRAGPSARSARSREENVSEYRKVPALARSPRRRC